MNKHDFAEALGLTVRQVDRLLADKTIPAPHRRGSFDLDHVRAYVLHLRRGEGVQEARRQAYLANAIDRRARTAARLRQTLTDKEFNGFLAELWLVYLDSWRQCAKHLYGALVDRGLPEKDAHLAGGEFHGTAIALIGAARDYGQERLPRLLRSVADEARVQELMKQFEAATTVEEPSS